MARGRQLKSFSVVENGVAAKEAAKQFFNHNKAKGLAADTQKSYKAYVNNFVRWYGEDKDIALVRTVTLDDYLNFKREEGIRDTSLASIMKHLRRFFKFTEERSLTGTIFVTIPKAEKIQKEPYTKEEMERLLRKPKTDSFVEYRSWVMVNYFYGTGQRLSTVLNIQVKHVDFVNSRVFLVWNKDKRQKYMPISPAVSKILREYIFLSGLEDEDYLFPNSYEGGQLKRRGAEDAITDYNKSRGVEKTSIHLFRHTFAKDYIMAGGSPAKLQKLLNHKDINTTMNYVNLYSEDYSNDLDIFNPLDNFKRNNYKPQPRRKIG